MASLAGLTAAIINLNGKGHYIMWHWFQISYANLVVIGLMIVAFVAALALPFPGRRKRRGGA